MATHFPTQPKACRFPMNQITDQTRPLKRTLIFHGTREDALERLPSLCRGERLELGARRISLVADGRRVDMRFRLEARYAGEESPGSICKLEFSFIGEPEHIVDLFVYRFCTGGIRVLH